MKKPITLFFALLLAFLPLKAEVRSLSSATFTDDGTLRTESPQGEVSFTSNKPIGSELGLIVCAQGDVVLEGLESPIKPNAYDYSYHKLTRADVSIKGNITGLWIKDGTGGLTSIDLHKAPELEKIYIGGNPDLQAVDVSMNPNLAKIYLPHTGVSSLLFPEETDNLEIVEVWQTKISLDGMAALIESLPVTKFGGDLFVQEFGVENSVEVYKDDVKKAKDKKWKVWSAKPNSQDVYEYLGIDNPNAEAFEISFNTSKKVGETLMLQIDGVGEVTAEGLNPSTIVLGEVEPTEYTLTAQDVTIKGDITEFKAQETHFTSVDFSKAPNLEVLSLENDNDFTSIDLSKNNALRQITCSWGAVNSITLPSEKENLEELNLEGNYFDSKSLDVSEYVNLYFLNLGSNEFYDIDLSSNESLEYLYLGYNHLENIDVSNNLALSELQVSANHISSLDVSALEELTYLDAKVNKLSSIDLTNNYQLKYLNLSLNTALASLDLSSCPELRELNLSACLISDLDLSENPELQILNIGNTRVKSIDLSNLELLTEFLAGYTDIEDLDFSHNLGLSYIFIPSTKITSLNLQGLSDLTDLTIYSNELSPEAMHEIVEGLPTVPSEDEDGESLEGWIVIQHLGENPDLKKSKGFDPIEVYKEDVAKATEKNWKLKVYSPDTYDYADYGKGIDQAAERMALGKWYVAFQNGVATIFHAPEGARYRIYGCDGKLIERGKILSDEARVDISDFPEGTYLFAIEGEVQMLMKH